MLHCDLLLLAPQNCQTLNAMCRKTVRGAMGCDILKPKSNSSQKDGIIFTLGTPKTLCQKTKAYIDHCMGRKAAIYRTGLRGSQILTTAIKEIMRKYNHCAPTNLFSWRKSQFYPHGG